MKTSNVFLKKWTKVFKKFQNTTTKYSLCFVIASLAFLSNSNVSDSFQTGFFYCFLIDSEPHFGDFSSKMSHKICFCHRFVTIAQRFSIGLISRLYAGQSKSFRWFSWKVGICCIVNLDIVLFEKLLRLWEIFDNIPLYIQVLTSVHAVEKRDDGSSVIQKFWHVWGPSNLVFFWRKCAKFHPWVGGISPSQWTQRSQIERAFSPFSTLDLSVFPAIFCFLAAILIFSLYFDKILRALVQEIDVIIVIYFIKSQIHLVLLI